MKDYALPELNNLEKVIISVIGLPICINILLSWIKHRKMTKGWVRVIAEVIEVKYNGSEGIEKLIVKYNYQNEEYVSLVDVTFHGSYGVGERTKVLIDPNDPQKSHTLI